MDSNSFLAVFGLKPEDFCEVEGPVVDEWLVFYEAWEAKKGCGCPKCGKAPCHVHHRYSSEVKANGDALRKEIVCIHRIVYRCDACGKTFADRTAEYRKRPQEGAEAIPTKFIAFDGSFFENTNSNQCKL